MRILTVRQPWAWAIIHGGKDVENRVRSLGPYRGLVAIHAASREATPYDAAAAEVFRLSGSYLMRSVLGAVIGVVDLRYVHVCTSHRDASDVPMCIDAAAPLAATCSPWAQFTPGVRTYHHGLANPRPLAHPIPAKGRLGLWRPDAELEAAIREQLSNVPHDPTNEEKAL